jgi:hypothetical protein
MTQVTCVRAERAPYRRAAGAILGNRIRGANTNRLITYQEHAAAVRSPEPAAPISVPAGCRSIPAEGPRRRAFSAGRFPARAQEGSGQRHGPRDRGAGARHPRALSLVDVIAGSQPVATVAQRQTHQLVRAVRDVMRTHARQTVGVAVAIAEQMRTVAQGGGPIRAGDGPVLRWTIPPTVRNGATPAVETQPRT